MAKNGQAVKSSGGEAATGKGYSSESASLLADGAALIESMLPEELRSQVDNGADSEAATAAEGEAAEAGDTEAEEVAAEGSESESSSQEESPEGETTEGTEEDTENTEGEEVDPGTELTPGQKAVNERFAALTAKRKQAEEERDGLKAQLDEVNAKLSAYESDGGAQAPKPQGWVSPVDRIPQVREAREATTKAAATRELAERLLAGEPEAALEAVRAAGVKVSDAEGAQAYLKSVQASATKAEAKLEARLAAVEFQGSQIIEGERQQIGAQARKAYPWLLNRAAPERKMFEEVSKALSYAKDDPAFELFVADAVVGSIARQKAAQTAATSGGKKLAKPELGDPRAALKPKTALGKPRAVSGAGTVGRGNDGDSIRDQAMKDPTNEAARQRYLGRMAGV